MSVETARKAETKAVPEAAAKKTIQWAAAPGSVNPELEAQFEAMRARNWITDRMVEQYQKHWHCSREQALERLLPKVGE